MKNALFISVSIFLALILTFIAGEITLRVWDYSKGVTPRYTHNMVENLARPNGYFNYDLQPDVTFFYDSKNPKKFSINRWGFRSPEYDPIKPKNTIRIFFLGGSSTFDPYVSDENTWTNLTGEILSKHTDKTIEAINAGKYGFGSHEIFGLFYHRILRHSPDMIVLYSALNDTHRKLSPYYGADDGPQLYGNPFLSIFNNHSAFFTWLDVRIRHFSWGPKFLKEIYTSILPSYTYYKKPGPEHENFVANEDRRLKYMQKQFKKNIKNIINIAQNRDIKVMISTQLIKKTRRVAEPANAMLAESLVKIAHEKNVPLLDLFNLEVTDKLEEELLQTYVHLTPKGCEFLSEKMAEKILTSNSLNL
jgi:lysophospholipase L1-like esterase